MHAVHLHAFGPAENLTYEEVPDPVPGPGQVRVRVAAAGVHLLDTALRQGATGPFPAPAELPTVPGREVAGTVDALGEGTDPSWLGERVVAHLGMVPGGYAELAVTDASRLHALPDHLGEAEAVAMIGTGRTTLGILRFTELGPESIAIVPAAAGGIGTLLVQYAKNAGATVVGLAGGPAKTALVRENGADLAVDYLEHDWPERVRAYLDGPLGGRTATVVFDSVGGDTGRAAVDLLGKGGQHVVFGWSGAGLHDGEPLTFTPEELAERGITSESVLGPVMIRKAGGDVRNLELAALAEAAAGTLRPAVHRFPLAEAAQAHRALENRGTTGKVVLVP
ncbi:MULTISPECIES: zinc-binding dehydrogenase [unclassified Streptomyces]|uniref:zinc-binding dehydrogenase n=1 Tax=unclassified Streptomyces TaxID=2593676 RepID=UPI0006ADE176|nr:MULTISPECIES: zinc-binding dehydrogenase [unclassified Streptomyces]KOX34285.1 oxidoreductase [Streptomyces sp. NRRL F-6491]KOX42320.1 oxidoreductase [Streptomyces sp. NRRL F-6492]